jgi:hypothetical protein
MYLSLLVLYDAKCSFLFLKKHKRGISGVFVGLNGNRKRQGRGVDHLFVCFQYIYLYIFQVVAEYASSSYSALQYSTDCLVHYNNANKSSRAVDYWPGPPRLFLQVINHLKKKKKKKKKKKNPPTLPCLLLILLITYVRGY